MTSQEGPYYLDSSVAVRILLGHSPPAADWFDTVTGGEETRVASSRLLRTELTRVLRREGLPIAEREKILDYIGTIPLDHAVLNEVEAIVPHLRTLDAIHIGSALRSGIEDLIVVTHDDTMRRVAEEIGYRTYDPVA